MIILVCRYGGISDRARILSIEIQLFTRIFAPYVYNAWHHPAPARRTVIVFFGFFSQFLSETLSPCFCGRTACEEITTTMPTAKAAVLERSRRSTAGKRMSSLVGKAQEDDDTFWAHSIWSETGGGFSKGGGGVGSRKRRRDDESTTSSVSEDEESDGEESASESEGEGSYRLSDDDPGADVDQFDSDFGESETEDEGGESEDEERELRAEERRQAAASKRKKSNSLVSKTTGREFRKNSLFAKRGPVGKGLNEGLVLNLQPPSAVIGGASGLKRERAQQTISASPQIQHQQFVSNRARKTNEVHLERRCLKATKLATEEMECAKRHARVSTESDTKTPSNAAQSRQGAIAADNDRKRRTIKRHFTQEQMIFESIKTTEPDNNKWLSSRKRGKEEAAQFDRALVTGRGRSSLNQKPVSRFHSRRGCTNTLTFMDMDRLPEILTRQRSGGLVEKSASRKRLREKDTEQTISAAVRSEGPLICVITGKVAKYRDPKTLLGYHDLEALKELKRRRQSGELRLPSEPPTAKNERVRKPQASSKAASNKHFALSATNRLEPTRPDVLVIVTQKGIPVSPPQKVEVNTKNVGKRRAQLPSTTTAAPAPKQNSQSAPVSNVSTIQSTKPAKQSPSQIAPITNGRFHGEDVASNSNYRTCQLISNSLGKSSSKTSASSISVGDNPVEKSGEKPNGSVGMARNASKGDKRTTIEAKC